MMQFANSFLNKEILRQLMDEFDATVQGNLKS